MRTIILATMLMATPAAAAELAPFDFMGYVAGEPIAPDRLKACGKGGDVTCFVRLTKLSTVYVSYMLKTHDYKITSVYVDAHPNSYVAIREAFAAKYGQPCERVEGTWRNAAGAELSNPAEYWCFRTGKLMLSRYGARIDKMGIFYQDHNQPPKAAPVVNF